MANDNAPKAAIIPRDPDEAHAYTVGVFDALAGAERTVLDCPKAYESGFSWGRLVVIRLIGETVGQAETFLDVRQNARDRLSGDDSPDFETLISRLEELADDADHRMRQVGDPGTVSYEQARTRRDAMIDAKNLVIKCRDGKTIR